MLSFLRLPSHSFSWGCTWWESPQKNQVRDGLHDYYRYQYHISLALEMPQIPLPAYRLCEFTRSPRFELAYVSLSLFFGNSLRASSNLSHSTQASLLDVMAFSVIVFISVGTGLSLPDGRPGILRTILEDATVYFLVIFSSHLLTVVVASAARVSCAVLAVT